MPICPTCGRNFTTVNDQRQHAKRGKIINKHGNRKFCKALPRPPEEMSLADIAVEASIKRACGEPLDELESSLIND